MEKLIQDIRFALRTMAKSPVFTVIAVLTIALGIGANTAIFTIVNAVIMRNLPVERPEELAAIGKPSSVGSLSMGSPRLDLFSYPLYQELTRDNEAFSSVAAAGRLRNAQVAFADTDTNSESLEPARVRIVTGNYFSTLGVKSAAGRLFTAEEDNAPGSDPVAVISYGYWTRRFNRDPRIIGSTVKVNRSPLTVIGVTSPGFFGDIVGEQQDLYVPMMMQASVMPGREWLKNSRVSWLLLIGRMKPGITLDQARSITNVYAQRAVSSGWGSQFDVDEQENLRTTQVQVTDGGKGLSSLRAQLSKPLVLLTIVVGLVLLIACVNVANLLLARAAARQTEMAVRLAIGASASRVMRQLLTESIVLSLCGGAVGLLLASFLSKALVRAATSSTGALPVDLSLDWNVLLATFAISLVTGALFGLVPALRVRSVDLTPSLKANAGAPSFGGASRVTIGRVLVAGQLALSVLVLFTAMLLVRSVRNLQEVETGFHSEHLLTVSLDLRPAGYADERLRNASSEMLNRIRALPGVTAATQSGNGFYSGSQSDTTILIDGTRPADSDRVASYDIAGPNFLAVSGVPLSSGRDIAESDTASAPRVAVVNETFARTYFGGSNPIGHTISIDDPEEQKRPFEIVGVARDIRDRDLREPAGRMFYVPFIQYGDTDSRFRFIIRTTADTGSMSTAVRKLINDFDSNIAVTEIQTVDALIGKQLSDDVVITKMTGMFAVLALVLACIGLYGVISYSVAGRARELGVRIALGANRWSVLWLVLRDAIGLIAIGIAVGLPLAFIASRSLRSMIFGVGPLDPIAVITSSLVLGAVGVFAAFIPARRATRVDPMIALRAE